MSSRIRLDAGLRMADREEPVSLFERALVLLEVVLIQIAPVTASVTPEREENLFV